MQNLLEYIELHTERGECQCGQCFDKGPDRDAPPHSVDVHFFWVSPAHEPTKEALLTLLKAEYPSMDRLRRGPSYIDIGGELGSQELALRLIGLGELVGLWKAITPKALHIPEPEASELAGRGMVMAGGFKE